MNTTHLQDYGLSEREAAVYTAALELGPATADQLAKHSGVKRSTTYLQIESLQEIGLMSSFEEGKKTLYAPESPENLTRLIERQKAELDLRQKELNRELPDLIRMFEGAGERPVVRFYQGKEGIISLRNEALKTREKQLFVVSSNDDLSKIFSIHEKESYSKKRAELKIKTKLLYTRKEGKLPKPVSKLTKLAYLPSERLKLATDMVIFDDYVGIMSLRGQLVGVMIKSTEIADSHRSLFELIWDIAEKH